MQINTCGCCGALLARRLLGGLCVRCVATTALNESHSRTNGREIGDYELLSELGRGGMGVVYLARQRSLDRLVAVKLLVAGAHASPAAEKRFVREAREAARLRHPHIVAIHDVGRHEELLFYSMDLIEGEDLESYVARHPPRPRGAARLVACAARAVQHAHEAGVLHRDLKPANFLVDAGGEPHLTDFGLVTSVEGGAGLTRTGAVMGSPSYMAPEQLRSEATVASDVYGLGAVLYFLLTGRPPFVAAQLPELLAAVEHGDPLPPRRLDPSIPRDLETIALCALARDAPRRYSSAAALAEDLERWLAGHAIQARPVGSLERGWRWARRNRSLAAVGSALAFTVVMGTGGIFGQWRRAERAAASTAAHLYSADLKAASDALLAGDLGTARRMLTACPTKLRDTAWGLLWPETAGDAEAEVGRARWTVTHIAVSRDGALAATTSQADNVRLWDLASGRPLGELPDTDRSWWSAFSPDGRELFTADREVKQWDVTGRKILRRFPGQSGVLSPDGKILYTSAGHRFLFDGPPGKVAAWEVASGAKRFELPVQARILALSSDGRRLAISDAKSYLAIHDALDGREVIAAWPSLGNLSHLTFSPDDALLVASGWSTSVRVWNLSDTSAAPRRLSHPLNTWDVAFRDGRMLAVACSDRTVHLWNTHSWSEHRALRGHDHEAWSLAWQPDGRLLSSGRDARVLRWQIGERATARWLYHDDDSYRVVWLPENRLATVRRLPAGKSAATISSVRAPGEAARFPGEIPLTFDAQTNRLWLWSFSGELRGRLITRFDDVTRVPWPQDTDAPMVDIPLVAAESGLTWVALSDGSLEIRRLKDGARLARHSRIFGEPTEAAAISPDGRWFVWGGGSDELNMLDLTNGHRERLEGHRYKVASVLFSPDGKSFVSGGTEGLIFEWETAGVHRRRELGRHLTSVGRLAFSPDGAVLLSQEPGVGVHLWHRATGRNVGFLAAKEEGTAEWLGMSPEGHWLALRRAGGEIRVFPVAGSTGARP